ncbi:unnamed protein product [Camellia sinensis]
MIINKMSELKSVWRERGGASRSRARVGIWNIEVLAWGLKSCKDQRTLRLAFAGPDWNLNSWKRTHDTDDHTSANMVL